MNGTEEGVKPTPRKKRRDNPLASLGGLVKEASRVYRAMKADKIDHENGKARVWVLAQIRAMLEAQELEKLTTRLEELQQLAERRHGTNGHREPQRLIDAETLTN